jgi:hypothetical protein
MAAKVNVVWNEAAVPFSRCVENTWWQEGPTASINDFGLAILEGPGLDRVVWVEFAIRESRTSRQ